MRSFSFLFQLIEFVILSWSFMIRMPIYLHLCEEEKTENVVQFYVLK